MADQPDSSEGGTEDAHQRLDEMSQLVSLHGQQLEEILRLLRVQTVPVGPVVTEEVRVQTEVVPPTPTDDMSSTPIDTKFLKKNYEKAMSNIDSLRSRGCKVIHEVDATKMLGYQGLNYVTYDRIVYNFPHAGFSQNEPVKDQVRRNQDLVSEFMANAAKMIEESGEIHISHKCNCFFQQWGLQKLGEKNGLVLIEEVEFKLSDYPGYNTKYGYGVTKTLIAIQVSG
ncbi:hypothetical protein Sjap_003891 [Stephania japonica]|uniref:25S rRNA (uridine-N(3))-methyltransferase BMT5-like domain-containing protein n=1 Tax=Stephania japonica TaxID=461633 RepID=A0AAP0KPN9_9MAGN